MTNMMHVIAIWALRIARMRPRLIVFVGMISLAFVATISRLVVAISQSMTNMRVTSGVVATTIASVVC